MTDETIFTAALEKSDRAERTAFVAEACGSDPELLRRVAGLLAAHDKAGEFLNRPAVGPPDPEEAATRAYRVPGADAGDGPTCMLGEGHDGEPNEDLTFLARPHRPDSLGRIGHYEVLEVLGRGGFGIVFRAFDEVLQRVVAVKVLAPQMAALSPARKRFLREARSSAQVRHENVVQVYAVEEQPLPYLVMEYIPGETLQQKLDRSGPLDLTEVLQIGRQLAEGLAAAHATDLIHRDIKPGNVLIEGGQHRVKITDFGLARAADDASISQSGIIAGTPMYMAPEQAQGQPLDQRADLFSLGSVLYQMVAGRAPFRANSTVAVLKRVCEDTPRPIREIIPETPQWLCDIIAKLHAKDPDDRYQSARVVADLLARCLLELQQHGRVESLGDVLLMVPKSANATPEPVRSERPKSEKKLALASRPTRSRRWAAAAAILIALFVGLGMTEATGVTNVRGTVIRLFSPDGTLVVEVDDPGVSVTIDGEEMVITGTGAKEIRLKPGQYKVLASKDGKLVSQELVTVTKNGRQVVRVSKEVEPVVATGDRPKTEASLASSYKNTLNMEFVLVPKGKFLMGGGGGQVGAKEVDIAHDFYLGKYEVTQKEWELVMGLNPSHCSRTGGGGNEVVNIAVEELKKFPVEQVSWEDAQLFLEALNARHKQSGWVYRLPKEAEWEYACRGGPSAVRQDYGFDYYFEKPSNLLLPEQANFGHGKGLKRTCKVGSYPPNRLGLHDMHGNIQEWCDDPEKVAGGATQRVLRGGGWLNDSGYCRAAIRYSKSPSNRNFNIGLRLALVPVGADPDRRAAEWVLSLGGTVVIDDGKLRTVSAINDLPAGPWKLSHINLDNKRVDDSGLKSLVGLKNLQMLSLCETQVTDSGMKELAGMNGIQTLRLVHTKVTGAGLGELKSLRDLMLNGTNVTDAQLKELAGLNNLHTLDLTITKVTGTGLKDLAGLNNLQRLLLQQTQLTDEGAKQLSGLKGLRSLTLWGTPVSDAGLIHLKDCANLRELALGATKVTKTGVEKLAAALPQCKIEWDGGAIDPNKASADPDRRAAEWVLRVGGRVRILANGVGSEITKDGKLPDGPFQITGVLLIRIDKINSAEMQVLAGLTGLKELDVGGNYCDFSFLKGMKGLERLHLAETSIRDADLVYLKELAQLKSLSIGQFFGNKNLSDAGVEHLLGLKQLETLHVNGASITDAGLERLTTFKKLRYLHLGRTKITDAGLAHLAGLTNLEHLNLWDTRITDSGLSHLKNLTKLELLSLESTLVTDDGLQHLKSVTSLKFLNLANTLVTDDGLQYLQKLKNLEDLCLIDTKVRGAGLVHLKDLTSLSLLNLAGTQVTDSGLEHLKELKGLTLLSLRQTKVTAAGVAKLAAALPKCQIVWDGSAVEPLPPTSPAPRPKP